MFFLKTLFQVPLPYLWFFNLLEKAASESKSNTEESASPSQSPSETCAEEPKKQHEQPQTPDATPAEDAKPEVGNLKTLSPPETIPSAKEVEAEKETAVKSETAPEDKEEQAADPDANTKSDNKEVFETSAPASEEASLSLSSVASESVGSSDSSQSPASSEGNSKVLHVQRSPHYLSSLFALSKAHRLVKIEINSESIFWLHFIEIPAAFLHLILLQTLPLWLLRNSHSTRTI